MVRTGTHIATSPADSSTNDTDSPSLRFDRRRGDRHPIGGAVTALRRDRDVRVMRQPVCSLQMRNLSHGGLSAISNTQLLPNERISVFIPSHGGDGGQEIEGQVLRCTPLTTTEDSAYGCAYEVAIRFDRVALAA